jgi:hypothetical protein
MGLRSTIEMIPAMTRAKTRIVSILWVVKKAFGDIERISY